MLNRKFGNWSTNTPEAVKAGHVSSDNPDDSCFQGPDDLEYYGGYLVAESVPPQVRPLIIAAPKLLASLRRLLAAVDKRCSNERMEGSSELAQSATEARELIASIGGE